jgi:energy-coupling factor transporter transmembrane protein EcfT
VAELNPSSRRWTPARLDVRLKLTLLCAVSLVSLKLGISGLLLLLAPAAFLALRCRALLGVSFREGRWILWMLSLVFIARALSTDGTPWIGLGPLAVTREGLGEGAVACLRLALVFVLGGVFIALTPSAEIKAGVQWLLAPLPGVPAARVGAMLALIARFIPLMAAEATRVADAQRARLAERRRNPIRRLAAFGLPLIRRMVQSADQLATAMEARCYTEARTGPELSLRGRDWALFTAAAALLAAALLV